MGGRESYKRKGKIRAEKGLSVVSIRTDPWDEKKALSMKREYVR
jgi:hypothetical protein